MGGFLCCMAGSEISWCSRKQTDVEVSSCEAKYIYLTATSKEAVWLRRVLQDMLKTWSGLKGKETCAEIAR